MAVSVPFLDSKGTHFLDSSFWIVMSHRGFFHQRQDHPQVSLRAQNSLRETVEKVESLPLAPSCACQAASCGLERAWPQKSYPS